MGSRCRLGDMSGKAPDGGPTSQIRDLQDQQDDMRVSMNELRETVGQQLSALKDALDESLHEERRRLAELIADGARRAQEGVEEVAEAVVRKHLVIAYERIGALESQYESASTKPATEPADAAAASKPARESMSLGDGSLPAELANELANSMVQLTTRCEGLEAEVKRVESQIERTKATTQLAETQLAEALERQHSKLEDEVQRSLQIQSAQLATMAGEVEATQASLQGTNYLLKNVNTRSVSWTIRGFKEKLATALKTEDRSVRSSEFSICAQPEMFLELVVAGPAKDGSLSPSLKPPIPGAASKDTLPLPGSFSVRVWAPYGFHLVFKLSAGEGAGAAGRRYEHLFVDGLTDLKGRSPFLAQNLSTLDQAWVHTTNSVTISLELLDLRCQTPEDEAPEIPGPIQAYQDAHGNPVAPDALSFSRSIFCEALVVERFKNDLNILRNRSVRRIEWRVQGVTRLLELLSIGEQVESPFFSACGIDRMQLHFYPRGTDRDGSVSAVSQPCALYVSAPQRVSLKGTLTVGSSSRHFEHRYQRRGDMGGRNKFCSLENSVDAEDSILLSLDIVQVELDLPENNFNLLVRDISSSKLDHSKDLSGTKGSMRMRRSDPSSMEEAYRCMSLPTLNTQNTQKLHLPQVGRGGRSH